jgi:hypothetical protein
MPDPRAIEARLKRLLATWTAAGQTVGAVELRPDGTIRILAPEAVTDLPLRAGGNTCDAAFLRTGSD